MSEYETTGPHGSTECLCCFDDISGEIEGPYCSMECKQYNENYTPSANDYLTDEQQEACGHWG